MRQWRSLSSDVAGNWRYVVITNMRVEHSKQTEQQNRGPSNSGILYLATGKYPQVPPVHALTNAAQRVHTTHPSSGPHQQPGWLADWLTVPTTITSMMMMLLKPKLPREWIITQINDRLGNKLQMHLVPKNSSNATCRLRAPWGGHRHFQIRKLKQRQQRHRNPTSTHLVNSPAFHSILIPHHNKNVAKKSQIFFNFGGYKTGWWQGGWSEGWRWKRYYTSMFVFISLTGPSRRAERHGYTQNVEEC